MFLNRCRRANDNWNDSISWSTNDHRCHCHHPLLHQKVSSHKITRVVLNVAQMDIVFFSIHDFYFVFMLNNLKKNILSSFRMRVAAIKLKKRC